MQKDLDHRGAKAQLFLLPIYPCMNPFVHFRLWEKCRQRYPDLSLPGQLLNPRWKRWLGRRIPSSLLLVRHAHPIQRHWDPESLCFASTCELEHVDVPNHKCSAAITISIQKYPCIGAHQSSNVPFILISTERKSPGVFFQLEIAFLWLATKFWGITTRVAFSRTKRHTETHMVVHGGKKSSYTIKPSNEGCYFPSGCEE